MTTFLFLQKFQNGIPIAMPYDEAMDVLARYGEQGSGRGDIEFTFPPDTIAASCTIIGNEKEGVRCIGFERPRPDKDLQSLVWAGMKHLGCAVFDDTLHTVCTPVGGIPALPEELVASCMLPVREIDSAQQLWPRAFELSTESIPRPALRYPNINANGPHWQVFDHDVVEDNALCIEFNIKPQACNLGTLRVIRNMELRIDAAWASNPQYAILYRFADPAASLAYLESPRLRDLAMRVTIISPPPEPLQPTRPAFVADRLAFLHARALATNFTREMLDKYRVTLDRGASSIARLEQILDKLHATYRQQRDTAPQEPPYESRFAIDWANKTGAYLGSLIQHHIGAQWGYIMREQQRVLLVRTHRGKFCCPPLLTLDHIINGSGSSIRIFFESLLKHGASALPRDEDLVIDIPGYCHILLGQSAFNSGGLPAEEQIPRDKLDYSLDSLHFLDEYLRAIAATMADFSDQTLNNLIIAAGAYLGEVVRGNAADKSAWQWVTYDDFVEDHPSFGEKRSRHPWFMAFLDSAEHTSYPIAHVAMMLEGQGTASTFEFAHQSLGNQVKAENGAQIQPLGAIDIQACVNALPSHDRDYPSVTPPHWIEGDPLSQLFKNFAFLLEHGRAVWAHAVQANSGLFEAGSNGAPGEIVYDPTGTLWPEALQPIASALFDLRGQIGKLNPNDPEQAGLHAIAAHLKAQTTRAFGLKVPSLLSDHPLLLSTVFFERKHLPGEKLVLPYFPVLINEQCPGFAMVLPGRWWPKWLVARVDDVLDEERLAVWQRAWQALAEGRGEEDERYFQRGITALENYARKGVDGQRTIDLVRYGMVPFKADTTPPPFEWEWDLAEELRSYGEGVLKELESERARGLAFNAQGARQAFAARYLAQLISLHRLLLCDQRHTPSDNIRLEADEIQYSALGLAAGIEEAALESARLLCLAWQRSRIYQDFIRPEVRVVFMLFAEHLGISLPVLKPFQATPHLDALLENGRWRNADSSTLRSLFEAASEEHTRLAPTGPFQGLPAAILLMLKLRTMAGLGIPELTHPLFATPVIFPGKTPFDEAYDGLVGNVLTRMKANGFRQDRIIQAIVGQSPLVVDTSVGTMPLHQDPDPRTPAEREGFNWIELVGTVLCFAAAWGCAALIGVVANRVLLGLLAIGFLGSVFMGLAYAVSMIRSLFTSVRIQVTHKTP
jgi:hypothetical protein